jgi:hypothetical protein
MNISTNIKINMIKWLKNDIIYQLIVDRFFKNRRLKR